MVENKDKMAVVNSIIRDKISSTNASGEDILLIDKLVSSYYRKRIGISHSAPETMAAAFLWVYSKSNFLREGDYKWSCQGLAELFGANSKTTGDVAAKISKILKIRLWDARFCKQSVMKDNPFDMFSMLPSGFIVKKEISETSSGSMQEQMDTKED
ncbi:MAG: hypothetical protein AABX11_06085 [Nanoarchaeota archaeon]